MSREMVPLTRNRGQIAKAMSRGPAAVKTLIAGDRSCQMLVAIWPWLSDLTVSLYSHAQCVSRNVSRHWLTFAQRKLSGPRPLRWRMDIVCWLCV